MNASRTAFAVLLVMLVVPSARAQDARVLATIEPSRIAVGETAELVVIVEPTGIRSEIEEPRIPAIEAILIGKSRESMVELHDSRVSRRVVFRYQLQPDAAGVLPIDTIEVVVDGRSLHAPPLTLKVDPAGALAGARPGLRHGPDALRRLGDDGPPPFFVTLRADRGRAVVGEQITLTFAFYHDPRAALAESPDYEPPETPGFWRYELDGEPLVDIERIGDRRYHVQRFRYALFPLKAGDLEIGPAAVRIVEPDPARWWRPGPQRALVTDPLTITVDPLPVGAPPEYAGAVGRYSLDGGVTAESTPAGVPIELELTVSGIGNPTTLGLPVLPAWPDIDVRSPTIETKTEVGKPMISGEATYRWLLAPRVTGKVALGSARFAYFDPVAGRYAIDTLSLGEIQVLPSGVGPSPMAASEERSGPTLWPSRDPSASDGSLAREHWYWAALAGPWLAWLAAAGLIGVRRRGESARTRRAALGRLAKARERVASGEAKAPAEALAAIGAAIRARYPDQSVPPDVAAAALEARSALGAAAYSGQAPHDPVAPLRRLEQLLATVILALLLPGLALASQAGAPPSPAERWEAANRSYRTGDFAHGARGYRALLTEHADPRLEANLAAALWQSGSRGEAVLHYRHALVLAPRSAAIRADFDRLQEELGRPPAAQRLLEPMLSRLRIDEILGALLAANILAFGLSLAAFHRRAARWPAVLAVGLLVLVGAVAGGAAHQRMEAPGERGVVLRPVAILPAAGRPAIATAPEGTIVRVLEAEPALWRVRAPGLPAGWVDPEAIVPLHSGHSDDGA